MTNQIHIYLILFLSTSINFIYCSSWSTPLGISPSGTKKGESIQVMTFQLGVYYFGGTFTSLAGVPVLNICKYTTGGGILPIGKK